MCSLSPVPHQQRSQPGLRPPAPAILPRGSASARGTGRAAWPLARLQGRRICGVSAQLGEGGDRGLCSAKLRLSIPAAPRFGLAVPRFPPQSLFERGCCLRPYLYFNAASKPGAFTSQRERERARQDREMER